MAGKGMALLAMLAPKKGERDEMELEDSDVMSEGKVSAMEDFLAALAKKDAQGMSDALEAHYACCHEDEESPKSGRY